MPRLKLRYSHLWDGLLLSAPLLWRQMLFAHVRLHIETLPPLLTSRTQLRSRSVSGLSIGPVGSIVKPRARSSPCWQL